MAYKPLPTQSEELLIELTKRYPDILDVSESLGPFERGKVAGVIELLRELKYRQKGINI